MLMSFRNGQLKTWVLFGIFISIKACKYSNKQTCRPEDGEYLCKNGNCINRFTINDGIGFNWCTNNQSNTWLLSVNCNRDEFKCETGRCIPRYMLNTNLGCTAFEKIVLPCRDDEFTCKSSKRCIPRSWVKNGRNDCVLFYDTLDTSDEDEQILCNLFEYRCWSTGQCVLAEEINMTDHQCVNLGVGELPVTCSNTSFPCKDGTRCLSRHRVRDGFIDCEDESDEHVLLQCDLEVEFRCTNGRCISRSWINDGTNNCKNGEDEMVRDMTCTADEFKCESTPICLDKKYVCDGINHCGDCSDEIGDICLKYGRLSLMTMCPNDTEHCILNSYMCDAYIHCPKYPENVFLQKGFKCKMEDDSICTVPQNYLSTGVPMCVDLSDLCLKNSCTYCLTGNVTIAKWQICDGVVDCPDLSDECLCVGRKSKTNELCSKICYNGNEDKCIRTESVCNFVNETSSGIDEQYCGINYNTATKDISDFNCYSSSSLLNSLERWGGRGSFPVKAHRCDKNFECLAMEDECEADCVPLPEKCQYFNLTIVNGVKKRRCPCNDCGKTLIEGPSICDGLIDCPINSTYSDESNCPGRFTCMVDISSPHIVSIKRSKICDGVIDCSGDRADEVNCSSLTHFYCKSGIPLFVPASARQNGIPDCADASDECPNDNSFSTVKTMKENALFSIFLWTMAAVSTVGNLYVISSTMHSFYKDKNERATSKTKSINKVLILNLAISDLLVGVALLAIGAKSAQMRGMNCFEEGDWRSGSVCTAIGILIVVGSETSVCTLLLITAFRLYSVIHPLQARFCQKKRVVSAIVLFWLCIITTSLLPLVGTFGDRMITTVIANSPYFEDAEISLHRLREFRNRLYSISNKTKTEVVGLNSWEIINKELAIDFPNFAPTVRGYLGYYGAHGVCMPRIFHTRSDENPNPLNISIMSFNLIAMLTIAISYFLLYYKSMRSSQVDSELNCNQPSQDVNRKFQRKLTILVMTDVVCWLPMCIISLVSMTVAPISSTLYAVAATVLLPINSSLNPLIYSETLVIMYRKLLRKKKISIITLKRKTI